jgi:uncharacterized DUF497 family protein
MSLEFEWDSNKAAANLKKHGVAFDEALTVFGTRWRGCSATPTIRLMSSGK